MSRCSFRQTYIKDVKDNLLGLNMITELWSEFIDKIFTHKPQDVLTIICLFDLYSGIETHLLKLYSKLMLLGQFYTSTAVSKCSGN